MEEQNNVGEILVGRKPTMNYFVAVVTQLQNGKDKIVLKARGMNISKAISVVEIVKHRLNMNVESISTDTELIENKKVSTISIVLSKA